MTDREEIIDRVKVLFDDLPDSDYPYGDYETKRTSVAQAILALICEVITGAEAVDTLLDSLLVGSGRTPEQHTIIVTEEMMYDALDAVTDATGIKERQS